ncbi:MAG: ABC transporter permease subunit [Armatimonadetes bacterium]|nr:ABC transporter permease subunit [Armatimonadota bacterium]
MASTGGPIADLSYRGYDGQLDPPTKRWKVIAMHGVRTALKQNGRFWFFTGAAASWYYLVMLIVLFVMDQLSMGNASGLGQATDFFGGLNWDDQFIQGIGQGCFGWLFAAVAFASGAIANDNRSNAMLVYLSKPCTKRDYLIGKWVGVWIPLTGFMLAPSLIFYVYGAFNYRAMEFISQDPFMIVKVVMAIAVVSAFYTSIAIGISSLFNQGRMAGATLVGVFIFPYLFVRVMSGIMLNARGVDSQLLERLSYLSIDRITSGLVKLWLDSDGARFMGGDDGPFISGPPEMMQAYPMIFGIGGLAVWIAWKRIRAVEVVK